MTTGKIKRNDPPVSFGRIRWRSVYGRRLPYPQPADKVVADTVVPGVGGILNQLLAQALGIGQG